MRQAHGGASGPEMRLRQGADEVKAGRRRHKGRREPNGQPSRTEARDAVIAVVVQDRMSRYSLTREQAKSPHAGYALGRLLLRGQITPHQHLAGIRWASLDARYRLIYGLAPVQVPAMPIEPQRGQSLADGPREPGKIIARYRTAERRLSAVPGRLWAVEATCIYDEPPRDIDLLIDGLDELVWVLGIAHRD